MVRRNPLKRALRADKLTLSALEATLRLYLGPDTLAERLPTLRYLTRSVEEIGKMAEEAAGLLRERLGEGYVIGVEEDVSQVGSGSLPGCELPTRVVTVRHPSMKPERIYRMFLESTPPILGRIRDDRFALDLRAVEEPPDVCPDR